MTIDWLKYIKDTLPVKLREAKIVQLIHVLISKIKELHDEINDYTQKARLYASCTAQVCWLQRMLRSELGDDTITVTEGDGLPTDFVVTCNNWILETKLKGLLNRFKMAGKSYEFNFTDVDYTVRWGEPVCEKIVFDLEIIDSNDVEILHLYHDKNGTLINSDGIGSNDNLGVNSPYFVKFITQVTYGIAEGDPSGCTITLLDESPVFSRRKELAIDVAPQISGAPARLWILSFNDNAGGANYNRLLYINQEAY